MIQPNGPSGLSKRKVIGFIKRTAIATVLSLSSVAMGEMKIETAPITTNVQTAMEIRGGELRITLIRDVPAAAPVLSRSTVFVQPATSVPAAAGKPAAPNFSSGYRDLVGSDNSSSAWQIAQPAEQQPVNTLSGGIGMTEYRTLGPG